MPERASRKEATTSCVVLPIDDTMPIPVTTARFMLPGLSPRLSATRARRSADRRFHRTLEEPHSEVARAIDGVTVHFQPAVRNTQNKPGAQDPLQFDAVLNDFGRWKDHAGELHFCDRKRSP